MKKYSALIFGSFLVLCGLPSIGSAQFNRGRNDNRNDRVCVYHDNNYTGREQCFNPGDEIADLRGAEISSIRMVGRVHVIVYENPKFSGQSAEFTSDVTDLARRSLSGSKTWNDRVGSLRVVSDDQGFNARGRGPDRDDRNDRNDRGNQSVREGICVYENANYQGRSECWSTGTNMPDLSTWSDHISSIRVFGPARVQLYRDVQFRGEREVVDHDIPNLAQLPMRGAGNWNNQASSLQIEADRGPNRRR